MSVEPSKSNDQGFIKLFFVIVIVVAILIYFGLNPKSMWEGIIRPILEFVWSIFIKMVEFFFDIAIWLIEKLRSLI